MKRQHKQNIQLTIERMASQNEKKNMEFEIIMTPAISCADRVCNMFDSKNI